MDRRLNRRRRSRLLAEIRLTHAHRPSYRDLAAWTDIPPSTVHYYLGRFEREGLIRVVGRGQAPAPLKLFPEAI